MPLRIIDSNGSEKIEKDPKQNDKLNEVVPKFLYGKFNFDYTVNFRGLNISLEEKMGLYNYKRSYGDWKKSINLSLNNGRMVINPVEPLNLPDNVTDFMEIDFDPIIIEPEGRCVVFLTMPIEIGVFVESEYGSKKLIDILTYVIPKYTMYGEASRGLIARVHKSKVYYYPPKVKNYLEGVLKLEISNKTNSWATVGKLIIFQKSLFIYYDDELVSASAEMVITNGYMANVTGIDEGIHNSMTRSLRTYKSRKLGSFYNLPDFPNDTTFTMDMGLI